MSGPINSPSRVSFATAAAATALLVALSRLVSVEGDTSLIWPPLGIALGLQLAWGWKGVFSVIAGLLLWVFLTGQNLLLWPLACVEVLVGACVAVFAMRKLPRRKDGPLASLARFYLAAVILGGAASALVGSSFFMLAGIHPELSAGQLFLAFWVAEAMGALVFTGLTCSLARDGWQSLKPDGELALQWFVLLSAVFCLIVLLHADLGGLILPMAGLLVVWPAMRAGPAFLNLAVLLVIAVMVLAKFLVSGGVLSNRDLLGLVLQIAGFTVLAQLLNAVSIERRQMLERERVLARTDLLTGLANERALRERLSGSAGGALLVLRIEDITGVADLLGSGAAEDVERTLAGELSRFAPEAQVSRLDRGRFGIFSFAGSEDDAIERARTLYSLLDGRVFRGDSDVIALRPTLVVIIGESVSPDSMLLGAEAALAVAASRTGERIEVVTEGESLLESRRELLRRQEEVKAALTERRFELYAQPIVSLGAQENGLHCEILLRLRQRDGTIQAPGYFLNAAERAQLTGAIDRYVIETLLDWLVTNPVAADRVQKCAINLTGWSVSDPDFGPWIASQVKQKGVTPHRLCFEITESQAIASRDVARRLIEVVRAMGSTVSLDDFGTGLATFDYLKSFHFDYLKIDGAFVRNLISSPVDQAIVQSITQVAGSMGLQTIAEFVENDEIKQMLKAYGVNYAQGYSIGKPVPLRELFDGSSHYSQG